MTKLTFIKHNAVVLITLYLMFQTHIITTGIIK